MRGVGDEYVELAEPVRDLLDDIVAKRRIGQVARDLPGISSLPSRSPVAFRPRRVAPAAGR
jgi:hypothetical protein